MIARGVASLWRGEVALARVFWEYAMAWGTLANILGTGLALTAFVNGAPAWLGLLLYFAATPFNALMVVSTWRAAGRESRTALAKFAPFAIVVWFLLMLAL